MDAPNLSETMEKERQRLNKVLESIAEKRISLDQEERSVQIELAGIQAYLDAKMGKLTTPNIATPKTRASKGPRGPRKAGIRQQVLDVVKGAPHAITKDGARYFGLMSLQSAYGDYTDTVILRNSHDKKFPIGIGFGSRVFVCDNLAFVADQVVRRKHTVKAKHELPALISELVEPLATQREAQYKQLQGYKYAELSDSAAYAAIMRMFKEDVINVTRIPDVLEQWENPTHDWGEKTVWRLFNAATFSLAGRVAENPQATATLHRLMDDVVDV